MLNIYVLYYLQLQQQQSEEELVESEIPTNRPPATLTGKF